VKIESIIYQHRHGGETKKKKRNALQFSSSVQEKAARFTYNSKRPFMKSFLTSSREGTNAHYYRMAPIPVAVRSKA
jgi:hypothetical protein